MGFLGSDVEPALRRPLGVLGALLPSARERGTELSAHQSREDSPTAGAEGCQRCFGNPVCAGSRLPWAARCRARVAERPREPMPGLRSPRPSLPMPWLCPLYFREGGRMPANPLPERSDLGDCHLLPAVRRRLPTGGRRTM